MTVKDMRTQLQKIDIDFNRRMSLIEFLLFHYKITDWAYVVRWLPAGSPEQLEMMRHVQAQMKTAQDALNLATSKAEDSKAEVLKAADAASKADEAKASSEKAAIEQQNAAEALVNMEKAKADAIVAEEAKTKDDTLSTVKRNKAIAQLKILQNEDSQPLRTARITASAAGRKMAKAAKLAAQAAETSKEAAETAAKASADADKALEQADAAVAKLTEELEEAKAGSKDPIGSFWWLDREFEDSLRFMGPKQRAKAEAARAAARRKSAALKPGSAGPKSAGDLPKPAAPKSASPKPAAPKSASPKPAGLKVIPVASAN